MNILWDLRLYSYGYKNRGIGRFCTEMIKSFPQKETGVSLFIWGDPEKTPDFLKELNAEWIPYRTGNWKSDLFIIPRIIIKYKIDIFHYWVTLGPLWKIGIGLFHTCATLLTVYDLGVEFWSLPNFKALKKSFFWYFQKKTARRCDYALCISKATEIDLLKVIPSLKNHTDVIYVPLCDNHFSVKKREPYFIALGGSIHKNCGSIEKAFLIFKKRYPFFKLLFLGEFSKDEEFPDGISKNILFESMDKYIFHLTTCSGLLFCSLYEGLGIPALEAMSYGCPLLVSNIAPLRETCGEAACYIDPLDINSIANGMELLVKDQNDWINRSRKCARDYSFKSENAGMLLRDIYKKLKQ